MGRWGQWGGRDRPNREKKGCVREREGQGEEQRRMKVRRMEGGVRRHGEKGGRVGNGGNEVWEEGV